MQLARVIERIVNWRLVMVYPLSNARSLPYHSPANNAYPRQPVLPLQEPSKRRKQLSNEDWVCKAITSPLGDHSPCPVDELRPPPRKRHANSKSFTAPVGDFIIGQ